MKLSRYHEPLPRSWGRALLLLNAIVGLASVSSLTEGNPKLAAILALTAGALNEAVKLFVGTSPAQNDEKSTDSTLSDRRERLSAKKRKSAQGGQKGGPR